MSSEVTVKNLPATVVVAHRTTTTFQQIFADIPAGFGTVMAALTRTETDPIGPPFTMYYQAPDGDTTGDIAMCIPIAATNDGETKNDTDKTDVISIDEGPVACLTHKGSYDDMGESYATIAAWIQQRGHSIVGPTREIYLNSPAEVAEAELLTEILFPIDAEEVR